jgi:hypothetical protein
MAQKRVYITKKTGLPQIQYTQPIEIHQQLLGKQALYLLYHYCYQNKRGVTQRIITKSNDILKTRIFCSHYNTSLYRECFWEFHYFVV